MARQLCSSASGSTGLVWVALLCVLALRSAAGQGFPLGNNFPYGAATTDTNLFGPAGSDDGMSAVFQLTKPFKFFNSSFASYVVFVNGTCQHWGPCTPYTP